MNGSKIIDKHMKRLLIIIAVFGSWAAGGQIKLNNKGVYGKEPIKPKTGLGFAQAEVVAMVDGMYDKMGFRNAYSIQSCAGISNYEAIIDDNNKPAILYNDLFLQRVKGFDFTSTRLPDATEQDWKALTVLAHELGHHVNLHLLTPRPGMSGIDKELQADRFAGHMMHLFGASLQQAQAVLYSNYISENESYTHPSRARRLAAVKQGWEKVKQPVPPPPTTVTGPIEMVPVAGGTFQMESNEKENEKPIHTVTVSSFYLGKTEVTQKQWRDIMGTNPSLHKGCDDCPVEQISWYDAQNFLEKLNNKFPGHYYRLPTEAEWEYAARGGKDSKRYKYSGSNMLEEVAYYSENSGGAIHAVNRNSKRPNELGIYEWQCMGMVQLLVRC